MIMNWVDLSIIGFLILFFLQGYGRGLFNELLDLAAFLASFIFSMRFYNFASTFFETNFSIPHSLAKVLGFITVWFLIESVLFTLINFVLSSVIRRFKLPLFLRSISNLLSGLVSSLRGLVFVALLLLIVGTFPIQPKIKADVSDSKIGSLLLNKIVYLEAPFKNIFGGITQDMLGFVTIKPKSNESIALGFVTSDYHANSNLEQEMIDLVNKERGSRGLKTLKYNLTLRDLARAHSADMFNRGYFSHYSPEGENVVDRANKFNVQFLTIGENLAYAPSLELAHQGLMNSPGHRANILSEDFNQVGIGIMDSRSYGLMVTQVFTN